MQDAAMSTMFPPRRAVPIGQGPRQMRAFVVTCWLDRGPLVKLVRCKAFGICSCGVTTTCALEVVDPRGDGHEPMRFMCLVCFASSTAALVRGNAYQRPPRRVASMLDRVVDPPISLLNRHDNARARSRKSLTT